MRPQVAIGRCHENSPPPPHSSPRTRKAPSRGAFRGAPKRTRTSTRLSRTRPSSRWALDRRVVLRTAASLLSAVENTLDTLDGLDVVKGVVAMRDQGGHKTG